MDDVFRLDLADYDRPYIEEVLDTFVERACGYGRKVIAIRMSKAMFRRLGIKTGGCFRDVPVAIVDNDCEETIELILGPLH